MILVLGGTTEGRELADLLKQQGYQCILSVAGPLGRDFASDYQDLISGELNHWQLAKLVDENGIKIILDATHPYAQQITLIAQLVAEEKSLSYLRYQRPTAAPLEGPNLFRAADYGQGLEIIEQSTGGVFLTIGVRKLHFFRSLWAEQQRRVWVKVLPVPESINHCLNQGLRSDQIFAFHGTGSKELVSAILQQTGAEWLVTKESGSTGGTDVKVNAAFDLGRRVLLIDRPPIQADLIFDNYQAILDWLAKTSVTLHA